MCGDTRMCIFCSYIGHNDTDWTVCISIPYTGKRHFASPKRLDHIGGPPSLILNTYRGKAAEA
jgi:hypothetical protein